MSKDVEWDYDIYKIMTEERLNKKKIALLILMLIVLIGLIMLANKSMEIISEHKIYQQYEAQVIALQKQEEERQAQIEKEKEKIRQSKIPKLTQERKNEYGKYLSFRNQKGIFDF